MFVLWAGMCSIAVLAVPPRVLIPNLLRASSLHLSLSRDSTGFVWLGCGLESIPLLIPPSSWPIYFRPICWHHNKFSQTPHSLTIFMRLILNQNYQMIFLIFQSNLPTVVLTLFYGFLFTSILISLLNIQTCPKRGESV